MTEKIISNVMSDVLDETYTYLKSIYSNKDIMILKQMLLNLSGIKKFEFKRIKEKNYSYDNIQEILSTLNEKESIRKSKGVYYTPNDVVRFIIENSIKSVCGKLNMNGLHVMDLNGISYRSFCFYKSLIDPTCGAGEFLLAALEIKFDLLDNNVEKITEKMIRDSISTIYGNDINDESTFISKIRLFLCALKRYGLKKCCGIDQILNQNFTNWDFISETPDFGMKFDIIIGNPPYIEDGKSNLLLRKKYGNVYANVLSNSSELLNDNGTLGFVIPLSYISTPRMKIIRDELLSDISEQYILSYADRPDCLFKSVHQKLCIIIGKKKKTDKRVYTGNYQYWYKEERIGLFERTSVVKNDFATNGYIPKLGTETDVAVYKKICGIKNRTRLIDLTGSGNEYVYLNMRAAFWIKAFRKKHMGSEYKPFGFTNSEMADYFFCLMNSSLFWWYWICVSDCWHITNKELYGFLVPSLKNYELATKLAGELEERLEKTKLYVGTKQTEYEYKHKFCTDEIHAIDDFINALYGLTDDENLYIKNFAYRYRISGGTE